MATRNVNGASIRAIREALGRRGSKFATECHMSHGYLCNIEKGRKQPPGEVAQRIADELGVPLAAITYPVEDCKACETRGAA